MTRDESPTLFDNVTVGRIRTTSRLVMAPMTRMRADSDGTPTDPMITYYAQRASAGMIVVEATSPDRAGRTFNNTPAIFTSRHRAAWRRLSERVHDEGGRLVLQLQHGGRIGHPAVSGVPPMAPSPIVLPDVVFTADGPVPAPVPREMTDADIAQTIDHFARAALHAVEAGFDGVEVHSANGFLLHQFLAENTNQRTDGYGGTVAARSRLTLEVTRAVIDTVGADRVGVRIAPGFTGFGIAEGDPATLYGHLVPELAASGAAYLHVVFADPDSDIYRGVRAAWPRTLIANPALPWPEPLPVDGGRAEAERLLASGADLVALGRAFLANPDLVARFRMGAPLNDIRPEHFYGGADVGYLDYPALTEPAGAAVRREGGMTAPARQTI
ncbi:N-ethylmaleimide reductase [Nocardioides thalensis]|uniref:N-ethylmaleimide reductase n=1 Tax=Nocardioides thalensis TaxID=1914755 RepID=A0A853BYV2_9ACTN|nr:alkene reductase [Nocardioides thalensis]NYI99661.1 N-ethylmaleimide reductase [Nocardioides thalensis]